jgi:tetratricopeptide (TPR) repeat protein
LYASLALIAGAAWQAAAGAPYVPASDAQVLERLPLRPTDPVQIELRALRERLSRDPNNLALATRLARRYIELGRTSGDPRYAGYAQAALSPWWSAPSPPAEVLLLRATLRQRTHEFRAALDDLDLLLQSDPAHAQARLTRATVLTVQGEFAAAHRECALLSRLTRGPAVLMCAASVESLTGRLDRSYALLGEHLRREPASDPQVQAWLLTSLAEMAERAGRPAEAESHFRAALRLDPDDQYLRSAYADFLLDERRPGEVLSLLTDSRSIDAHLLRYAIAAKEENAAGLAVLVDQLGSRFAASRMRGDSAHQREEARFTLVLLNDPGRALALANANWVVQKEPPDLRILLEAALAARDAA